MDLGQVIDVYTKLRYTLELPPSVSDPSIYLLRLCDKLAPGDEHKRMLYHGTATKCLEIARMAWITSGRSDVTVAGVVCLVALEAHMKRRAPVPASKLIAQQVHLTQPTLIARHKELINVILIQAPKLAPFKNLTRKNLYPNLKAVISMLESTWQEAAIERANREQLETEPAIGTGDLGSMKEAGSDRSSLLGELQDDDRAASSVGLPQTIHVPPLRSDHVSISTTVFPGSHDTEKQPENTSAPPTLPSAEILIESNPLLTTRVLPPSFVRSAAREHNVRLRIAHAQARIHEMQKSNFEELDEAHDFRDEVDKMIERRLLEGCTIQEILSLPWATHFPGPRQVAGRGPATGWETKPGPVEHGKSNNEGLDRSRDQELESDAAEIERFTADVEWLQQYLRSAQSAHSSPITMSTPDIPALLRTDVSVPRNPINPLSQSHRDLINNWKFVDVNSNGVLKFKGGAMVIVDPVHLGWGPRKPGWIKPLVPADEPMNTPAERPSETRSETLERNKQVPKRGRPRKKAAGPSIIISEPADVSSPNAGDGRKKRGRSCEIEDESLQPTARSCERAETSAPVLPTPINPLVKRRKLKQ